MNIEFKPETHEYFIDGFRYPSVTEILQIANNFSAVNKELLVRSQHFGTAVHKACELWDEKKLNEEILSPPIIPYLDAWKKFIEETGFTILASEYRIASMYGYAGTLDRYGILDGKHVIIDIKTGIPQRTTALQTAAYAQAIGEGGGQIDGRYSIQLKPLRYSLQAYTNDRDFFSFKSFLDVYKWRENNVRAC
jgi:hypothetical protein